MPFEWHDREATLCGVVTIDDVEPLVSWLRNTAEPMVDLQNCNHLHTGVLQALMMFRPKIAVAPTDPFLAEQVLPLLVPSEGEAVREEGDTS